MKKLILGTSYFFMEIFQSLELVTFSWTNVIVRTNALFMENIVLFGTR